MGHRHPNPRRVKLHRNYEVSEIARCLDVHKNTVRRWIKQGLATVDRQRPTLVLGRDLAAFLRTQRAKAKQPCPPGCIYCVKCRAPRAPAGGMADYQPRTATAGRLIGICPQCETMLYRCTSRAKLDRIKGNLEVSFKLAQPRIAERDAPSLSCDFSKDQ